MAEVDAISLEQAVSVIKEELKRIALENGMENKGWVIELPDFTMVTVMSKPKVLIPGMPTYEIIITDAKID